MGFSLCRPTLPFSFCKGKYLALHNFEHDYGGRLFFYKEDYKKRAWTCRCLVCIFSGTFFKTIFSAFLYFNSGSVSFNNRKQEIWTKTFSFYSIHVPSFNNNFSPAVFYKNLNIFFFSY